MNTRKIRSYINPPLTGVWVAVMFLGFCISSEAAVPQPLNVTTHPTHIRCVHSEDDGSLFHPAGDEIVVFYVLEHIRNNQVINLRFWSDGVHYMPPGARINNSDPNVDFAPLTLNVAPSDRIRIRLALVDMDTDDDQQDILDDIQTAVDITAGVSGIAFPPAMPIIEIISLSLTSFGIVWDFFDWLDDNDYLGEEVYYLTQTGADLQPGSRFVPLTISSPDGEVSWGYHAQMLVSVSCYNRHPYDRDNDGIGDLCDKYPDDFDNDAVADVLDNCPFVKNGDQADRDGRRDWRCV